MLRMKLTTFFVLILPLVALSGCAARGAGFQSMQTLLQQRAGLAPQWRELTGDAAADERVAELLAMPVGADEAVQIALLKNADLQARFEELGIARGQLVDASRPGNIAVDGDVESSRGRRSDFDLTATTDLTRLLFLPLRRGVATAALDATRVETVGDTLEFAHVVRNAFYEYQAADQMLELDLTVLEAATASYDVAQRLYQAGNITALELSNERAFYEQARSEATLAEAAALGKREELNAWMGFSGGETGWKLTGRFGDPMPESELAAVEVLEARAIENSLDLLGLDHRYTESARRANLARAEGLLPSLRAGAQVGRDESLRHTGPVVSVELPLFNQGQGRVDEARAEMRQVEQQYRARAVRIRAAVRTARTDLLIATRRVEHYRTVMLPLWEEIVGQTQRQYNAMQAGVFQLLLARREQVRTGQGYVMALRNYWTARSRFDQILAGRLVSTSAAVEMPEWR